MYSYSSDYEYQYIPEYSKDNCPDSLAWSSDTNSCEIECIYPFYSNTEVNVVFVITSTLSIIGFLMCYFYCFTGLFRPVMLKFPNSNIFFLLFSAGIFCMSSLFPLILGRRYVFCDTNTKEAGQDNWACSISGTLSNESLIKF